MLIYNNSCSLIKLDQLHYCCTCGCGDVALCLVMVGMSMSLVVVSLTKGRHGPVHLFTSKPKTKLHIIRFGSVGFFII